MAKRKRCRHEGCGKRGRWSSVAEDGTKRRWCVRHAPTGASFNAGGKEQAAHVRAVKAQAKRAKRDTVLRAEKRPGGDPLLPWY